VIDSGFIKPEAKIVVFACNWDSWSCIDEAGRNRLSYPPSVKIMRISCLSRVDTGLMLKAFELGADGVILLGCEKEKCHFQMSQDTCNHQFEKANKILKLLGIEENRLVLVRLPGGDYRGFIKLVMDMMSLIEQNHLLKIISAYQNKSGETPISI
jgi:coenzyme F420-reducing hydrogenase delta subunit